MMNLATIIKDINEIGGDASAILVSLHRESGEAVWGEVMALPVAEMTSEMESLGYSTDAMLTGEEFLARYAIRAY